MVRRLVEQRNLVMRGQRLENSPSRETNPKKKPTPSRPLAEGPKSVLGVGVSSESLVWESRYGWAFLYAL